MQSLKQTGVTTAAESVVYVLEALPGTGKTEAAINHIAGNADHPTLIACKTIDLLDDTAKRLQAKGLCPSVLHSKRANITGHVVQDLCLVLAEREPIILCTHDAYTRMNRPELLNGYSVFIDEVIDPWNYGDAVFSGDDLREILSYFEPNEGGILALEKGRISELKTTLANHRGGTAQGWSDKKAMLLTAAACNGYVNYDPSENVPGRATLAWLSVDQRHLEKLQAAETTTILCASFNGSLTEVFYKSWNVQIETSPLPLPPRPFAPRDHVVYPMLNYNDKRASRYLLEMGVDDVDSRNMTITVSPLLSRSDAQNLRTYTASRMAGLFDHEEFIWYQNKDQDETLPKDSELPYSPEGLNHWDSYHCAASLFTYNPSTPVSRLFRLVDAELNLRERTVEAAFIVSKRNGPTVQQISRTSIRVPASTKRVQNAVFDQEQAEYIKSQYPDARIDNSRMLRVQCKIKSWPALLRITEPTDRKALSRLLQRLSAQWGRSPDFNDADDREEVIRLWQSRSRKHGRPRGRH